MHFRTSSIAQSPIDFLKAMGMSHTHNSVPILQPFGEVTLGPVGLLVIPLLVAASAFGAANGSYYNSSRLMYVAAREGHAPKFLAGLHVTTNAPVAAVLLQVSLEVGTNCNGVQLSVL